MPGSECQDFHARSVRGAHCADHALGRKSTPAHREPRRTAMKVKDVMSVHVHVLGANDTIETAAQLMLREDIGSVPVHDGDKLIGMVTDRDIVTRGIAAGRDASTPIGDIMSTG